MVKSKFPPCIARMIQTAWKRQHSAVVATELINKSVSARKRNVKYTVRQIAARMAWHTINSIR